MASAYELALQRGVNSVFINTLYGNRKTPHLVKVKGYWRVIRADCNWLDIPLAYKMNIKLAHEFIGVLNRELHNAATPVG